MPDLLFPASEPKGRERELPPEIMALLRHHVPEGAQVLGIECREGDNPALKSSLELGLDKSMPGAFKAGLDYQVAHVEWLQGDVQEACVDGEFDAIILDHLTENATDIRRCLDNLYALAHSRTRLYIISRNPMWFPRCFLAPFRAVTGKRPPGDRLSGRPFVRLLEVTGWEIVLSTSEVMCPWRVPLLQPLLNRWFARLPIFCRLGSINFTVVRPKKRPFLRSEISCSVVVPVRNEAGNISAALQRIPTLGARTQVIFVEGNSTDDTWEVVRRECEAYSGPHLVSYCQHDGVGKWDAVASGFDRAQGDVLVILDGDLTVPPEDLVKFYACIQSGTAEFANGSRLVYPMEKGAMRFLNLLANKFFAIMVSAILRQPVRDTLCGTKMLLRTDYKRLSERIKPLGNFDPFGDFSLLFGAALLDLKIHDVNIAYRARTYGKTNISRFHHGWQLLKAVLHGFKNLRFHRL